MFSMFGSGYGVYATVRGTCSGSKGGPDWVCTGMTRGGSATGEVPGARLVAAGADDEDAAGDVDGPGVMFTTVDADPKS